MNAGIAELRRRFEREQCRFFIPNGAQERMIKAFGSGDKTVSIFSGGNGAGKTYLMVNILANLIWGKQNSWFKGPLFEGWEFPRRVRIGTESANVRSSGAIDDAISRWWPKGRYTTSKDGAPYVRTYTSDTGWIVEKMSYEQETREWESSTLGLVCFDEPPPRDKYMASVARLRKGGRIAIFMTPLMKAGWLIDEISGAPDVQMVYADIEDNCKIHGQRGHLLHEDIERMVANMDPDEVEARAHGKPMHLSNVILGKTFQRHVHVVPENLQPPAGGVQWGMVVDPARGKPWAIAWFWVDRTGRIVFTDEYPVDDWLRCRETNLTIADYAKLIRHVENGRPMQWRIIDRHFANARNDYGTTLKQDLSEKFGLDFSDSYACDNEIESGIQKTKDYFGGDKALGPRLLIKENCRNIIKSMERWERDERLAPNIKSPYKDHFDLVRYACSANLEFDTPVEIKPRPQGYVLGR